VLSGLVRGADRRARLLRVVLTQVVGLIEVRAGETPDASPVAMRAGAPIQLRGWVSAAHFGALAGY